MKKAKKNLMVALSSLIMLGMVSGCSTQGPKGDVGQTGAQGEKGDKGDPGKDAVTYVPCIFQNWDGSKLFEFYYERGSTVVYTGPTPTKPSENGIDWTFKGWDKSLENIQIPTLFTAVYGASNAFECTFLNYDGTLLSKSYCLMGGTAAFRGAIPTKASESDGSGTITKYEFSGWDKSLKNIQGPTTFTAQFVSTPYYECKFVNYDGTLLYKTDTFKGGTASYEGNTPEKEQDAQGTMVTDYTFSEWDKSLGNIQRPTTFTDQYSSTSFTGYKVTFKNNSGEILYSHYYEAGKTAKYPFAQPWSYDEKNVHLFAGWSESLKNLSKEMSVTAIIKTITREQNGEYPQRKVTDESLISILSQITRTDSRGYVTYDETKYLKTDGGHVAYYQVEPIQWRWLDTKDDGKPMYVSEKCLEEPAFGAREKNYKDSSIRKWLNGDFLKRAFSDDSLIATTLVDNSIASTGEKYNPYVCENTNDRIFLLSRQEMLNEDYFADNESRVCYGTGYGGEE